MDMSAQPAGSRRKRKVRRVPAWVFYILAAAISASVAFLLTSQPPPDIFFVMVRGLGTNGAAYYVLVEGGVIGLAVWAVLFFADQVSGEWSTLILLAAAVTPSLAISDWARFHYLDVLRDRQAVRTVAAAYHDRRDRMADQLNADMDRLRLFDISYRAWTVHPGDFAGFESNIGKARQVLARAQSGQRALQPALLKQIGELHLSKAQQDRVTAVAMQPGGAPQMAAFWSDQARELDETKALLAIMERVHGGKLPEAEFAGGQAALFALVRSSNAHYDQAYKAEDARELALVAAVR